ncbi:hypothetical protein [Vogesella mureinivorans]|uniref:hypothetical protein n=1 Tax=Vogesella mureinivorans TaxID=657276 RepID=UPI0011C8E289|nr:hypothetical protein [Vogesella mureinivorans]
MQTKEKSDLFVVAIQMGAIAAVIYEYWGKLWGAAIGLFSGEPKGRHLGVSIIAANQLLHGLVHHACDCW